MIRVLLVDDQALVRTGLRMILEVEHDVEVVGEAEDGLQAVERATALAPDVVVMDLHMPRLDGVEATRRIQGLQVPQGVQVPRVLVVTTFDDDARLAGALRSGAAGFLLKTAPAEQLVAAVRAVAAGQGALSEEVTQRVIAGFAGGAAADPAAVARVQRLTPREHDVLELMARGLSNHEIGQRLFVSPGTAKTHVAHILAKLEARDRVAAVVIARDAGVVTPDPS